MQPKPPSLTYSFTIEGESFDPTAFDVGLQPSEVRRKGEKHGQYGVEALLSSWEVQIGPFQQTDIEEGIQGLLDLVWTSRRALCKLARYGGALMVVSCWGEVFNVMPSLGLGRDSIARLAYFPASLSIDLSLDLAEGGYSLSHDPSKVKTRQGAFEERKLSDED